MTVSWISERLQTDERTMRQLRDGGVMPGATVIVRGQGDVVEVVSSAQDPACDEPATIELSRRGAGLVYVERAPERDVIMA